jgi:hypothetical protein
VYHKSNNDMISQPVLDNFPEEYLTGVSRLAEAPEPSELEGIEIIVVPGQMVLAGMEHFGKVEDDSF